MKTVINSMIADVTRDGFKVSKSFDSNTPANWPDLIEFHVAGYGGDRLCCFGRGQVALDVLNNTSFTDRLTELFLKLCPAKNDPGAGWRHELYSEYSASQLDHLINEFLPEGYITGLSLRTGTIAFILTKEKSVLEACYPTALVLKEGIIDSVDGEAEDYIKYLLEQIKVKKWVDSDALAGSLKYDRRYTCPKSVAVRVVGPDTVEVYFIE